MKPSSQLSSTLPCKGTVSRRKAALIYNEPVANRYGKIGEQKAILAIMEGVEAAHKALEELGYGVARVPLLPPIERTREVLKAIEADVVFNLFEGFDGRPKTEAVVAGILSDLGLNHTGCPSAALSLALEKAKAKDLMQSQGIKTPRYQILNPDSISRFQLKYPCIVKPCGEDASHGLSAGSVVEDEASLERQVVGVSRAFGGKALVEEFVDGREFNATVMGFDEPVVLPISEIVYSLPTGMPPILTYAAKWEEGTVYFNGTTVACPAEIGEELRAQLAQTAVGVFTLLVKRGYARVDMRLDSDGNIQVLEANPNPDITPGSGAARQAAAASMTYPEFIQTILSLSRYGKSG